MNLPNLKKQILKLFNKKKKKRHTVLARHATQQIVVGVGDSKISRYKTSNKKMFHVPL